MEPNYHDVHLESITIDRCQLNLNKAGDKDHLSYKYISSSV